MLRGSTVGSVMRSLLLWTALLALALAPGCDNPSKTESSSESSAAIISQQESKAEVQAYLVKLASDAARWRSDLQAIDPSKICGKLGTFNTAEEIITGITKTLDSLQTEIQTLAQQETLGGDIELLARLQTISLDSARLSTLLPCPSSRNGAKASAVAAPTLAAWSDTVREIQNQAAEDASVLRAHAEKLARSARVPSDEERREWIRAFGELAKALAWPLAVALGLLIFRRPLSRFLEQIAGKITKLSVFEVAIELATVPSAPTPWLDPAVFAGTELFGGAVTLTTIMTLFDRISDETVWHYLIVDLEDGRHWLESRLYLFTTILQQMGGLRCVIFVESNQGYYRRFLGMATPEDVRLALATKYWWFRPLLLKSFRNALLEVFQQNEQTVVAIDGPLPKDIAKAISEKFIFDPDMQKTQDPQNPEWSKLEPFDTWDHSQWLTMERFNKDLRGVLFDPDLTQLEDTPETPADERARALLRRQVPFVAMVTQRGEFKRLIDRQLLAEQVAAKVGAPATEPTAA